MPYTVTFATKVLASIAALVTIHAELPRLQESLNPSLRSLLADLRLRLLFLFGVAAIPHSDVQASAIALVACLTVYVLSHSGDSPEAGFSLNFGRLSGMAATEAERVLATVAPSLRVDRVTEIDTSTRADDRIQIEVDPTTQKIKKYRRS